MASADRNANSEALIKLSKKRSALMEDYAFKIYSDYETADNMAFIISTADFDSSMYYAPVTSIRYTALLKYMGIRKGGAIEYFRNVYPIGLGREGFVTKLYTAIRGLTYDKLGHDPIFLCELSGTGSLNGISCSDPQLDLSATLDGVAADHKDMQLSEKAFAIVDKICKTQAAGATVYFVLHPSYTIDAIEGRPKVELNQIGFTFIKGRLDQNEPAIEDISHAINVSCFATIALLFERERYFQKAIRTAIKGRIAKYGDRDDIGSQIKRLETLNKYKVHSVPNILAKDKDISNVASPFAWYMMPRFAPTSMLDLLAYSSGFEQYEVNYLAKACVSYMKQTYWGRPKIETKQCVADLLFSTIAVALDMAMLYRDKIRDGTKMIRAELPYKFKRMIDIFSKEHIPAKYDKLIDMIDSPNESRFTVNIEWNGEGIPGVKAEHPIIGLKAILANAGKIDRRIDTWVHLADTAIIHGDSHYGNFLVDASIPEDPLVITIDPAKVSYDAISLERIVKCVRPHVEKLNTEKCERLICKLAEDPAYDIAKLVLSTACCYGLAYRHAFAITPNEDGKTIVLKRIESDDVVKLSDIGGVSGSQIVTLGPRVNKESWRNHRLAATTTVDEYEVMLDGIYDGEANAGLYKNVAFIRLFILTIRHALEMAEMLFPVKIEQSFTMYLLTCCFLGQGLEVIKEALRGEIANPRHTDKLKAALIAFPAGGREPLAENGASLGEGEAGHP